MKRIAFGLLAALAALAVAGGPALADPAGAGVNPGTAGTQSYMMGCVYRSGSISPSNGQQMGVACDSTGKIITTGSSGGGTQDVNIVQVGGNAVTTTVPVSAASLPLPTGAATAALQTTGNTSLSTLAGTVSAGSVSVVCASGCGGSGGTASNFGAAFPAAGTAVGFIDSTGTNMAAGNLDASGYLKVNVAAGGGGGGAVYGPTAVGSPAANPPVIVGGTSDATATGDVQVIKVDASGNASVALGAAIPAGSNVIGHVITDNTSVTAATQSGTWTVQPGNTANTTPWLVTGSGTAGSAASGVLTVQGISSMTPLLVTPAANSAVNLAQVGGTNVVTGGAAGSQGVGGTVATDVAITDNPLNLGAQAVSSENAAVTATRKVQLVADLAGKLITLPYANPENFVSGTTSAMTGTTSTSLVAAPGSGLRNYITQISCVNSHASVGTFVTVQDGAGGTALMTLAAGSVFGGSSYTLPTPLRQPTTNTALYVANVTTGANVICSATGYKGA